MILISTFSIQWLRRHTSSFLTHCSKRTDELCLLYTFHLLKNNYAYELSRQNKITIHFTIKDTVSCNSILVVCFIAVSDVNEEHHFPLTCRDTNHFLSLKMFSCLGNPIVQTFRIVAGRPRCPLGITDESFLTPSQTLVSLSLQMCGTPHKICSQIFFFFTEVCWKVKSAGFLKMRYSTPTAFVGVTVYNSSHLSLFSTSDERKERMRE